VPAIKLQTSRPTPLLKEMANFHRPRAVWFPVFKDRVFEQENSDRSQIRLVVKALGSIGKSVTVRVKGTEALEAVRAKVMSKWKGKGVRIPDHSMPVTDHSSSLRGLSNQFLGGRLWLSCDGDVSGERWEECDRESEGDRGV
jgi:hypothetical protein